MKKVIFSAIAMIAFVGSSMANTLEVEKIETPPQSCISSAIFQVNEYEQINGCLSDTQYNFMLQHYFNKCQSKLTAIDPC
jgi:hypothetical protein